jgi:hypothetical protein
MTTTQDNNDITTQENTTELTQICKLCKIDKPMECYSTAIVKSKKYGTSKLYYFKRCRTCCTQEYMKKTYKPKPVGKNALSQEQKKHIKERMLNLVPIRKIWIEDYQDICSYSSMIKWSKDINDFYTE